MKSEIVIVNSNEKGLEEALTIAETFVEGLSKKETLRLRLLAEEMMCLVRGISCGMEGFFWCEKLGNNVYMHLDANTLMYAEKRKQLIDNISTTGKNERAKGALGKILEAFELALLPKDERTAMDIKVGYVGESDATALKTSNYVTWRLSEVEEENDGFSEEEKEAMQKSIINKLAKEVTVSIVGDNVEVVAERELGE